jgi:hypothetical protein
MKEIQIVLEKVVKKDISLGDDPRRYKIKSVNMLTENDLPAEYSGSYPHCYKGSFGEIRIWRAKGDKVTYGFDLLYKQQDIDEMKKLLHQCGNRLHEINMQYRNIEKTWKGEVEIVI